MREVGDAGACDSDLVDDDLPPFDRPFEEWERPRRMRGDIEVTDADREATDVAVQQVHNRLRVQPDSRDRESAGGQSGEQRPGKPGPMPVRPGRST